MDYDFDQPEHGNSHDESNWLVSYADMMTLLFGFFVLMYSMSRVDHEKFTIVSRDLAQFFGGTVRDDTGVKVPVDDVKNYVHAMQKEMADKLAAAKSNGDILGGVAVAPTDLPSNDGITPEKAIEVEAGPRSLTLKFRGSILFAPGSAQIKPDFEKVLIDLGQKFKASHRVEEIRVEGHTDDDPIKSMVFPTNWELSSARASRIVRQFETLGLPSDRLIAQGFGSSRAEFPNRDEKGTPIKENQAKNRRVIIKVHFSAPKQGSELLKDEYFENVKRSQARTGEKVADTGAIGDAGTDQAIEQRIREAQERLESAQAKLRENQEEAKKQAKLAELEKKLEQINKKAQEVENRLKSPEPNEKTEKAPASVQ